MRNIRFLIEPPAEASLDGRLDGAYTHLADYYSGLPGVAIEFCWRHRPSVSVAAYREMIGRQKAILHSPVANVLEISLDLFGPDLAEQCRAGGCFDAVELRVDLEHAAVSTTRARLLDLHTQGIKFGYA